MKPSACALRADTYDSSVVNNTCAIVKRDTGICRAARIAAGLSGFWLNFSCRVTLSSTTLTDGRPAVQVVSDSRPDYLSNYYQTTDACYEAWTGMKNPSFIVAASLSMVIPKTPAGAGKSEPGVMGIASNGIYVFANSAAPGDDIFLEAKTFDKCRGHPNMIGYHYHSEPYAITYDDANFLGVMRDGSPIYGRKDSDGTYPSDLDDSGGHTKVTADSATAIYHYHVNEQTSSASTSLGEKQWFITKGKYKNAPGTCAGCMP